MSDTESHQAYIDASEASIPAENGPREVANDPPPLGRAAESVSDPRKLSTLPKDTQHLAALSLVE